jgi:4-carboxymuconolactone decarboxylase
MSGATQTGRELSEVLNPGTKAALDVRYSRPLPGLAKGLVDFAYGRRYARRGLVFTGTLSRRNPSFKRIGWIDNTPAKGEHHRQVQSWTVSRRSQRNKLGKMARCGGFPTAVNGLNTISEVFGVEAE